MNNVTDRTTKLLLASGWSKGRRTDIDSEENTLLFNGYVVTQLSSDLISEFQGISVNSDHSRIIFDVGIAIGRLELPEVPFLKRLFGDYVCPFGYEQSGSLVLFSSGTSERVFSLNEQWLCCAEFPSISEMLESLLFNTDLGKVSVLNKSQVPPWMQD